LPQGAEPRHAPVQADRTVRQQAVGQRVLAQQGGLVDVHQQAEQESDADADFARLVDVPEHQHQREEVGHPVEPPPGQHVQCEAASASVNAMNARFAGSSRYSVRCTCMGGRCGS
jgi:hypothetical protein